MQDIESKLLGLPDSILRMLADAYRSAGQSFSEWCQGIMVDGHQFSFKGREYLREPYGDNHIWQVKQKATQVGGTVEEMLRSLYGLIVRGFRNILYYFPSANNVTDFSQARIGPMIEENPEYIQKHVRETNRANLRQFGGGFLHLLGMRSVMSVKSIPAGMLIFDEFDEAPQLSFDKAMERIGGVLEGEGDPPEVRLISNPSLPDFGVSRLFEQTDQRYWQLICPSCGHYNCLEDQFLSWVNDKGSPAPLVEVNGRTIRACAKCRSELDPVQGEWVAKCPSVTDKRGYHYTELWSQTIMHSPANILAKYYTALETGNLQDFFNLVIGIGYVEAENRLSEEEILALCGSEGIQSHSYGAPCVMGVDDNARELHVVIGRRSGNNIGIMYIGTVKEWDELDGLMESFNVGLCVVDAVPDAHSSQTFVHRHKGRGFRHFYSRHQKGSYAWNEKDYQVQTNRTESLDASHNVLRKGGIILPKRCKVTEEFAKHCHNTARKLEEEEETDKKTGMKRKTGNKVYIWVKLGVDDYRHAFNYFCIALQQRPSTEGRYGDLRAAFG